MARKTPTRVRLVAIRPCRGRRGRHIKPGEEFFLPPGAARAYCTRGAARKVKITAPRETKASAPSMVDDPDALSKAEEKVSSEGTFDCPYEDCDKTYSGKNAEKWLQRHIDSKHSDEE